MKYPLDITGIYTDYGFYTLKGNDLKLSKTLKKRRNGSFDLRSKEAKLLIKKATAAMQVDYEKDYVD